MTIHMLFKVNSTLANTLSYLPLQFTRLSEVQESYEKATDLMRRLSHKNGRNVVLHGTHNIVTVPNTATSIVGPIKGEG